MKALQVARFGNPSEVLRLVEVDDVPPGPDELRVRIEAAGVNPSDVGNVNGRFPITTLPRIVGRDFAGTVVEGPAEFRGIPVWGSGGDIGFTRDGSHAEFMTIPVAAFCRRPGNLSAEEAAAAGLPFLTASAMFELARLEPGQWVIVSGAAGAVGNAAVQIASACDARVIALVRDEEEGRQLDASRVKAIAHSNHNDLEQLVRDATGGRGADIALNGIGASVFLPFLNSLRDGGRMVVYGVAFGGRDATLDLFSFYRRRHQLFGLDTVSIDGLHAAKLMSEVTALFESGKLDRPRIAERYRLSDGVRAYEALATAKGKVVLEMT